MTSAVRSYNLASKVFHWGSALMIIALMVIGMSLEEMPRGPEKTDLMNLHKAFGTLFLLVIFARLAVRVSNPVDPLPGTSRPDLIKAKAIQGLMYLAMLIMPISGVLMSQTGGHVVSVFGLFDVPTLIGENHDLHEFLEGVHGVVSKVLMALVLLHVGAALFHHFKLKDDTLKRML